MDVYGFVRQYWLELVGAGAAVLGMFLGVTQSDTLVFARRALHSLPADVLGGGSHGAGAPRGCSERERPPPANIDMQSRKREHVRRYRAAETVSSIPLATRVILLHESVV